MDVAGRLKIYWELFRPKTLLPPALGMISGSLVAYGADPKWHGDWLNPSWGVGRLFSPNNPGLMIFQAIVFGAIMSSVLNAASNTINQIADIQNDRINKPHRVLPTGRLSFKETWVVGLAAWAIALALALLVNWQCFVIVAVASVFIWAYSMPPARLKARGLWANFAIAVPRGLLLTVAGWTIVKSAVYAEAWYLGGINFLFILGACTTKDFSDMKGDEAAGCRTLPCIYGEKKAATLIAPSFIVPFLFIAPGVYFGVLSGNSSILYALCALLVLWGMYTVYLILKDPQALSEGENHPSWKHMYFMMMTFQVGLTVAYLV